MAPGWSAGPGVLDRASMKHLGFSVPFVLLAACGGGNKPTTTPTEGGDPVAAGDQPGSGAGSAQVTPPADPPPPPPPPPPQPTMNAKDLGFDTPESVLYDAEADLYLVSNIGGGPSAKDGNGFISRLRPDGTLDNLKWIDGSKKGSTLNAPKGMAVAKGVLYVADLDTVRMFDAKTGKAKGAVVVKGATFLNDVAAGADGTVYVSDSGVIIDDKGVTETGTDAVYKLVKGKAVVVAKSAELGKPNGLLVVDGVLWVGTFGTGEVYTLDAKGVRGSIAKPAGMLDGLFWADGTLYATSWEQKAIMRTNDKGEWSMALGGLEAPADAGYDSKRDWMVVPLFTSNAVVAYHRR